MINEIESVRSTTDDTSLETEWARIIAEEAFKRIAVVTGANRGIGYATVRQLASLGMRVVLTSRDRDKGQEATNQLTAENLDVLYHPLDVTDPESIEQLKEFVIEQFGRVDVLINNAGILIDTPDSSVFTMQIETMRETMETNFYGPMRLSQALAPLMQEVNYGRIVNISSGMGQMHDMGGGYPAYRVSKTALNALTCILADELRKSNVLVNAVCPGWVQTEMGGPGAIRTPEAAADTIVWLATLPDDGPSGGFFRDRKSIPW